MFTPSSNAPQQQRGFSFVEVLVTAALVTLVFGGLFASVQAMISLISDSKAKAGAVALATERLEYIRSLSYNAVGTLGAPPYGSLPETRTVVLNDQTYQERIVIRYEDDPRDGIGAADANGIITDYKKVKVEYSWSTRTGTSSLALATNVVPPGIETDVGGGTLRVYVNDANVLPVANAQVTVINTTLATTTNTTQFTNGSGEFVLSGLPAGGGYTISVTLPGYSTDGTATPTPPLSSPAKPVVSIAESAVTTQYFQIDRVSSLRMQTTEQPVFGAFTDLFTNSDLIATSSNTVVSGGAVVLESMAGTYTASGTVFATTTAPTPIESWYSVDFTASTTASTSVTVALYYPVGTTTVRLPDSDLPGNASGFSTSPINLTALDVSTYPELILGATLTTSAGTQTPQLETWTLNYIESQPALGNIPMTVRGAKVLGDDINGAPIYKNVFTGSTDSGGEWDLDDIEFDVYTVSVDDPALDVVEVCPAATITLNPNTTEVVDFTVASISGPRLSVAVTAVDGTPIAGATVRVEQSGYDVTQTTSLCGQTFFSGGLSTGTSTVTVSRSGYTTVIDTDVPITSTSTHAVQLN